MVKMGTGRVPSTNICHTVKNPKPISVIDWAFRDHIKSTSYHWLISMTFAIKILYRFRHKLLQITSVSFHMCVLFLWIFHYKIKFVEEYLF